MAEILVTGAGGGGFIGSHLDELLITGVTRYILSVITNLTLQIGGNNYGFN